MAVGLRSVIAREVPVIIGFLMDRKSDVRSSGAKALAMLSEEGER
jgi:hypothetical protein